MVEGFIEHGHIVGGRARSAEAMDELRQYPPPYDFDVVDVADDARSATGPRRAGTGGPPDLLVNNAGVTNGNATLWEVPADEFSR